jgi:hypothetical protein
VLVLERSNCAAREPGRGRGQAVCRDAAHDIVFLPRCAASLPALFYLYRASLSAMPVTLRLNQL